MLKILFVLFFIWFPCSLFAAPNDIIFWHSMAGQLGEEVNRLAQQFNHSQTDYRVIPIYKGDYAESLTSFAAAFRAKHPPQLIQVFEVGTSVMQSPKGIIKPVDVLMREQGMSIAKSQFFPAVLEKYSDNGVLLAMPFNISVPVLFYDADVLAPFGVSSKSFPRTWDSLESLAKSLHDAGFACTYTTAYPAWILIESYLALHGLTVMEGDSVTYNNKHMMSYIERMRHWQKKHYFEYGGRGDDATVLFTSGRCPIFSQSSGAYVGLSELVPFRLGVAPMPVDVSASASRHNNVVGGAALWVVAGQSSEMERGIAQFLVFLAQPAIQKSWYEHTGYLPLETQFNSSQDKHSHSILGIAAFDLDNDKEEHHQTLQPGPQNQIRAINEQMLEAVFSGMMSTKDAMDNAVLRANHVLRRFKKNTQPE